MSSRQMRRLKDLVDRATGLDASDEDDDALAVPSTVQAKKSADRHHDKKKHRKEKERDKQKKKGESAEDALAAVKSPSAPVLSSSSPASHSVEKKQKSEKRNTCKTAATTSSPTADDWEDRADGDDGTDDKHNNHPSSSSHTNTNTTGKGSGGHGGGKNAHTDEEAAAAEEERKRKKEERRKLRHQQRRQKQAEEEALLDAVLAHQAVAHNAFSEGGGWATSSSSPCSPNAAKTNNRSYSNNNGETAGTSSEAGESLQHFVMACDVQQLDTRLERIRMFGADAVEDVGDGQTPHRRADGRVRDTGSISFFPVHHLNVKFVHSAFATPNRYRWIPYDSLGIYLTTEEGHDAQGQVWREYTLNCDSNAFQRALAQLEACQDRMSGVQELVECLARSGVYHIPTLLQCVYTMEATGESAFAGELLEVALYQVGVILRRFALSGTWAQRRLPMLHGGNSLIFQVLQRGVHAALKRGCLRTAFERTRCLLSLDERDPFGMLLLLDYTALRAKRWVWLLEMRHRVLTLAGNTQDNALQRSITALPNFAFSWALAKHFIEREERLQGNNNDGKNSGKCSKVLRGMTDAQREALAATPAAEELLLYALTHFPHAAVRLVNALGGVENFSAVDGNNNCSYMDVLRVPENSVWFGDIMARAEDEMSDGALQQGRLAELFVARHEELWKLNECTSLLRAAVHTLVREPKRTFAEGASAAAGTVFPAATPASPITYNSALLNPNAYVDLTREAVLGASVAPIPADLLRPDAADLGLGVDGGVGGDPTMVDDATAELLLRFLRQHRENAGADAATQDFLQALEQQLGERLRVIDGGAVGDDRVEGQRHNHNHNNRNAEVDDGAAAGGLEWYDYDYDHETAESDAQEWYSVESDEGRSSDDDGQTS